MAVTHKCFLIDSRTLLTYGVVYETPTTVALQRMKLNSFGGLSPCAGSPIFEAKSALRFVDFVAVKTESEVSEHLMRCAKQKK